MSFHDPRPTGRAEGIGCQLTYDPFNGDYDCGYYSVLTCDQCKFGAGRKDPASIRNALPEDQAKHRKDLREWRKRNRG